MNWASDSLIRKTGNSLDTLQSMNVSRKFSTLNYNLSNSKRFSSIDGNVDKHKRFRSMMVPERSAEMQKYIDKLGAGAQTRKSNFSSEMQEKTIETKHTTKSSFHTNMNKETSENERESKREPTQVLLDIEEKDEEEPRASEREQSTQKQKKRPRKPQRKKLKSKKKIRSQMNMHSMVRGGRV